MKMAIKEAVKCPEGSPKVGAVLVKNNRILSKASRGEKGIHKHAEQCILENLLNKNDAKGATLYTTLEPCNTVKSRNKTPCADQIIEAGISAVYIGTYDINPLIFRQGWRAMRDAGIKLYDFDSVHRDEIKTLNIVSDDHFQSSVGPSGSAKFDFKQNGGKFDIYTDETKIHVVTTRWTERGADSIYAYGGRPNIVTLAKYATSFDEVDDPGAYDYEGTSAEANEGDIVIYRTTYAYVLIKVLEVHAGPSRGTVDTSIKINYQVRLRQ